MVWHASIEFIDQVALVKVFVDPLLWIMSDHADGLEHVI
jgi:hypothetical protein